MIKTAKAKNTLIESDSRSGAYGMRQQRAIIQHHTEGRLLLVEGFGGTDSVEGGMYRWKHGSAYKITELDTLKSIFSECTESGFFDYDSMIPLEWSGKIIAKVAESAGLEFPRQSGPGLSNRDRLRSVQSGLATFNKRKPQ